MIIFSSEFLKMKYFLIVVCCCFFGTAVFAQSDTSGFEEAVQKFRKELDDDYRNVETSPLGKERALTFQGHHFFPFDSRYCIPAKAERLEKPEVFKMRTTTDRTPEYRKLYKLTFSIRDTAYFLYAYQNISLIEKEEYKDHLFLPFTDKTNGFESYGGGRYIDLQLPEGDSMLIDFNKSYNPYCAYSSKYSCPIPPKENALPVKIEAGIFAPEEH